MPAHRGFLRDDDFRATRYYTLILLVSPEAVELEIIKSCSYAPALGAKPINLRVFQSRFENAARKDKRKRRLPVERRLLFTNYNYRMVNFVTSIQKMSRDREHAEKLDNNSLSDICIKIFPVLHTY